MGCHTWFSNKLSSMPEKDLAKLKEITLDIINRQTILNVNGHDEWVKKVSSWNIDSEHKKKFMDEDFFKKRRDHVLWAKSVLEADSPNKDTLFNVFKEFAGLVFESTYDLSRMGWGDNFRVYGYPEGKFTNADDAISFLKEYKQNNICYKNKKGYCDEIGNIIIHFFNEYPNGYIEYG